MNAPVIIAGAGIGGLTAALALARQGHEVRVFERTSSLREVGAGLQLSPNATSCLSTLGVLDEIRQAAFEPQAIRIRSGSSGRDLARLPLGAEIEARHGTPYVVIHRADLQQVLFEKAEASGKIEVLFGHAFESAQETPEGIEAVFTGPGATNVPATGSVLIGADGVWSKVRALLPHHAEAAFSGRTAYRATIPARDLAADFLSDTGLWLGAKAHLVHYPVRSGEAFNLVAIVAEDWQEETWSAEADRDALLHRFSSWSEEARNLMARPQRWLKWALCGVAADKSWTSGRIALLGDAAHGMLPFAAQGAAMAIEDALVLADCLTPSTADTSRSLQAYQQRRQSRVAKVQATAVQNGRIYHLSGPLALGRDTVLRLSSPESLTGRMDWIYRWKPPAEPGMKSP